MAIGQLKNQLISLLPSILDEWISSGKIEGNEFKALNPTRADSKIGSFSININTGMWADFATGDKGDIIDLYAYIYHLDNKEACKQLSEKYLHDYQSKKSPQKGGYSKGKLKTITPIPKDVSKPSFTHFNYGKPSHVWEYKNQLGESLGFICRYDLADGTKQILPRTYVEDENATRKWSWRQFNEPRPLYGLEKLIDKEKPVLICEGEKATDAAQRLMGDKVLTLCWTGGSNAIKKADFSPLKNRNIFIWPDADAPGLKAAESVKIALQDIASEIKIALPENSRPKAWDAADAEKEGLNKEQTVLFLQNGHKRYLEKQSEQEKKNQKHKAEKEKHESVQSEFGGELPFQILGYNKGSYYYLPHKGQQIIELSASAHNSLNLLQLAPLSFWQVTFPKASAATVDWQQAADHLISMATSKGIYSPLDQRRGLGAWNDNDISVLHLGDSLLIDGKPTPLRGFESNFTYEKALPLKLHSHKPLDDISANMLLTICQSLKWQNPLSGKLLAGWIVSAMVGGALSWRPHIWLSGSAGSGKTTVMRDIIGRTLKGIALEVEGKTTEAGIRAKLGYDALPILFDEAEAEDETDAKRMKGILDLARVASSESGGLVYKGSINGKANAFRVRSNFCFSSINTSISHYADQTRITPLILRSLRTNNLTERKQNQEDFTELMRLIITHLTPAFSSGLLLRASLNIHVLLHNIEAYAAAGVTTLGNRRYGDQIAPMLAGAKLLTSTQKIGFDEALEEIKTHNWAAHTAIETQTDEERLLQTIYEHLIRCHDGTEKTIKETIEIASENAYGDSDFNKDLARRGIRVVTVPTTSMEKGVHFSVNSGGLKDILKNTPWAADWSRPLLSLGAQKSSGPIRFAGISSRTLYFPIDLKD